MSIVKSIRPDYYSELGNASSGPKDFYRQGRMSKMIMAKFAVCPIFPSMFSDLQNYPNKQYVIRRMTPAPAYMDKLQDSSFHGASRQQVVGSDRYKYFHSNILSTQPIKSSIPKLDLSCFYEIDEEKKLVEKTAKVKAKNMCNAKVQTVYRDSSIQTSPWEPDYDVVQGDPELLMLDFLKWGAGLPAGVTEVGLIQRLRTKQKWERAFPEGRNAASFAVKRDMIDQISRTEWANRERDIDEVQQLRMELLQQMLNELHTKSKCRNEKKLRLFADMKLAEKRDKIARLQKASEREKRRLKFQYSGILSRYGKADVFEEHSDFKSELYCPLMRNGTNPKYRHEVLFEPPKRYRPQFFRVEDYSTFPPNIKRSMKLVEPPLPGTRLCIRETKWTLPVLKELYMELKQLQQTEVKRPNLRVCLDHESSLPPTPEVAMPNVRHEHLYEAGCFIEKVMRGRAVQNKIFKGRERCRELINELRGNYALLKADTCKKAKIREKRKEEQMNAISCMANMQALEGSLKKLGGGVTGTLLDFLNKDLQRLLRERRAHAMILLVERLRQIREAEEAGRRQKEIQRRKEHDEIFKQVVKVQQDSVDLYLQDIITEGMQFTSEVQARQYVEELASKIADDTEKEERDSQFNRDEYIASMVHNFVIPEVEKDLVRNRVERERKKHLKTAHETIFAQMDELPQPESTSTLSTTSVTAESEITKLLLAGGKTIDEIKEDEKQLVISDIQAILDDLVMVPLKMHALSRLVPCTKRVEDIPLETLEGEGLLGEHHGEEDLDESVQAAEEEEEDDESIMKLAESIKDIDLKYEEELGEDEKPWVVVPGVVQQEEEQSQFEATELRTSLDTHQDQVQQEHVEEDEHKDDHKDDQEHDEEHHQEDLHPDDEQEQQEHHDDDDHDEN